MPFLKWSNAGLMMTLQSRNM